MFDLRVSRADCAEPCRLRLSRALALAGSIVLVAAGLLAGAAPALAGDPAVHIAVTQNPPPLPGDLAAPAVTYSRSGQSLITYVAYDVRVSNDGTNVENSVGFSAVTAVENAKAIFVESTGLTCLPTTLDKTAISCPIGTLRGGGDFRQFTVVFQVPDAGTPMLPTGPQLNFTWTTVYSEGTKDNPPNASHTDTQTATVVTTLDVTIPGRLQSFVPTLGGTFFTGDGATATATDKATTRVVVPANPAFTTFARVFETPVPTPFSALVTTTNITKITIPGTFAQLEITLRRDASTINKSANIADAKVLYSHFDDLNALTDLVACQPSGIPLSDTAPCIFSRTAYTRKTAPNAEYIGDWEFVIHALKNGTFMD